MKKLNVNILLNNLFFQYKIDKQQHLFERTLYYNYFIYIKFPINISLDKLIKYIKTFYKEIYNQIIGKNYNKYYYFDDYHHIKWSHETIENEFKKCKKEKKQYFYICFQFNAQEKGNINLMWYCNSNLNFNVIFENQQWKYKKFIFDYNQIILPNQKYSFLNNIKLLIQNKILK